MRERKGDAQWWRQADPHEQHELCAAPPPTSRYIISSFARMYSLRQGSGCESSPVHESQLTELTLKNKSKSIHLVGCHPFWGDNVLPIF